MIQQNSYNGEGQRIQKVDGDETTNYYYQDGVVAYTTDTDGNQNSQNLIGTGGNVLATRKNSTECNTILSVQQRYSGKYK